ncbi:hypothetical protein R1flu_009222 [Riccia fluitans]|uniref:MYND-type domain-containing protein n=1 Tax=Riccia fluitans TaxID=41844 RepID=A0ABD1Z1Q6_9MARC
MDVHLRGIFECFQEEFGVGRGSDLLEVSGINTAFIDALFGVIAELWRCSPWRWLRSNNVLGIKVGTKADWKPRLSRQPFNCIRFSVTRNKCLVVDALRKVKDVLGTDGKPTRVIPESGILRLTLSTETDLFPDVRRMIRGLSLEVAAPGGYPGLEVISSSKSAEVGGFLNYRGPHLDELKWLIAALKAVTQVHPGLKSTVKQTRGDTFEEFNQSVEFALPTTADGYYLFDETFTLLVRVAYPPKASIDDMPRLHEGKDDLSAPELAGVSRQCVSCNKAYPPERALRCGGCKSVFYCGVVCQKKEWKGGHRDECQKYKEMMERTAELVTKNFSFTVVDFDRPCGWLEEAGLHQKGMWRRLCPCYQSCPYGHLPVGSVVGGFAHATAWGLESGNFPPDAPIVIDGRRMRGSSIGSYDSISGTADGNKIKKTSAHGSSRSICSPPVNITAAGSGEDSDGAGTVSSAGSSRGQTSASGNRGSAGSTVSSDGPVPSPLCSWLYYYNFRNLPHSSPVAVILTYPLTVYYAVTQLCASTKKILARNKEVTIHYLGPKAELDWLPAFAEIGHLLNAFHTGSIHIVMVGPEVPNSLSGEAITLGKKLRITYVQGMYQEEASSLFHPHMVMALNAGLDLSETWAGDLRLIKQLAVPTYFTDYTESCCLNAQQVLVAAELPLTMGFCSNPFRSPVRLQIPYTALPLYINGFIFGVNT